MWVLKSSRYAISINISMWTLCSSVCHFPMTPSQQCCVISLWRCRGLSNCGDGTRETQHQGDLWYPSLGQETVLCYNSQLSSRDQKRVSSESQKSKVKKMLYNFCFMTPAYGSTCLFRPEATLVSLLSWLYNVVSHWLNLGPSNGANCGRVGYF